MMHNALISGGNGFLGSYLVEKFIAEKIKVTVVDDLSTSKGRNIPDGVKFINGKIENYTADEKYDYVT